MAGRAARRGRACLNAATVTRRLWRTGLKWEPVLAVGSEDAQRAVRGDSRFSAARRPEPRAATTGPLSARPVLPAICRPPVGAYIASLSLPWLDGHLRKVGPTSTGSGGWR